MSFIITVYVPEGIVMAADSRLSLDRTTKKDGQTTILQQFEFSNSSQKLFLINKRIGLSTCGAAAINKKPIAGYIDQFIEEKVKDETDVSDIPKLLNEFFGEKYNKPAVQFQVAGFKIENGISIPYVYTCQIAEMAYPRVNADPQNNITFGCAWSGEGETISRLLLPCKVTKSNGMVVDFANAGIEYNFFSLQDAIDFAIYAIRTTIDTIRFQAKPKTVGNPIDVLIFKAGQDGKWIQRKEYHGEK